jgi:PPOX class probable F420-dependent enzyme
MALDPALVQWLLPRHQAVLATTRGDGTPQTSNISFTFDGEVARISVTADRAKTVNMRRRPGVVLHVLGDSFWQYLAVACLAELTLVSAEPGDETGRELLAVYEQNAGKPHPNHNEFFQAMVDDRRLVARLTPVSAAGNSVP